jgi:hypothetical protein
MRLERDLTLMQALATGGGLTQRGTEKGIRVHRKGRRRRGAGDRIQDGRQAARRRRGLRAREPVLEDPAMSFGQFLSILRARWWLALLVLGLTMASTLGASLLMPKQYTATASVVVDFKPDPCPPHVRRHGFAGFMATQVDIIRSERVAQRVVRNLKLNENPQVRQQWQDETRGQGSIEGWLGGVFAAPDGRGAFA